MFGKAIVSGLLAVTLGVLAADVATADDFGSGTDTFTIPFVTISGATNPTSGYGIVNHDYRMGTYEITNDQWNKFVASYGEATGTLWSDFNFFDLGTGTTSVPTNNVTWYQAAHFVNWLNTITGHQVAYKFTGTNYTFVDWSAGDVGYDAANPYRNKNARYFLPNENEWVKAAYWNGTALQTYATKDNSFPTQGDGVSGMGWNYYYNNRTASYGAWTVGIGSQELNGTYDMMGNNWEWMESPYTDTSFSADSARGLRGGGWNENPDYLASSERSCYFYPTAESSLVGFRVASAVPEPGSIAMLAGVALTALFCWWRKSA